MRVFCDSGGNATVEQFNLTESLCRKLHCKGGFHVIKAATSAVGLGTMNILLIGLKTGRNFLIFRARLHEIVK